MSLITSCPRCGTLFKAVPDQLRIADGWVRCGCCNEVFNASLHLYPQEPVVTTETPGPALSTTTSDAAALPLGVLPVPFTPELVPAATAQEPHATEPLKTSDELTFLHEPRMNSSRHPRKVRALLSIVITALLSGLAGQVVFHERNRLLALQPKLKPWLLAFCAPLNCSLSALQKKDAIVIDGAAFTKIARNSYRLNFTVKNTSNMELAVPSIELTLTDASEQPVVRRIFSHAEFDLKTDTLAAGSEWTASLAMLVNPSGATPPIVGYRLYVFYV